ncbi:PLP-dependent aminotransferase family protein [Paenibacillus sp. UNC499MF]|uniref:aminotransferase-like domain-containing protein n=1 Tax=Paenibacillus sp. UNC499MF TaxID=1502751 RepID=UPI0008A03163|nr:PLP-dependent aminotransferase family protein [Paenibacillus sp. UNC499MF]SEG73083.1 DNA-binding transcriptional regulator, MocR family, contains an aminotransferase domain [Paenibacillus sp. UNC499MF]
MHKYEEILTDLERQIADRRYKEGGKLPSIRQLSESYRVNKSTVIRALEELESRHLIYSMPRSGYFVVKMSCDSVPVPADDINFAVSAPDPAFFPYLDFQHCINKAIDTYKNDLFVYGTPQGLPELLVRMQKLLADYQVFTSVGSLFVVSGVQQALAILAALPFPNGKTKVLIEQPGYHLFIEQLVTHGVPVMGIRRSREGIDLDELERLFKTEPVKFFYTMPRFHAPLGSSYPTEVKKKIAALARKYDVYVVEDDYLADLEPDGKADPIHAYDGGARVIYLKSFSKIMFPGLRIGMAVIPASLVDLFSRYKRIADIDSSMISQGALEIYLRSGMFERHKHKIKAAYAARSRVLRRMLEEYRPLACDAVQEMVEGEAQSPVHTHLLLNASVPQTQLAERLRKKSVVIEPIGKHYLPGFPRDNYLKLNVSQAGEDEIRKGIRLLMEELGRYGVR